MSPSMFGLFTAGIAALAPLASAYTTPTGNAPKGNPISQPGLNTIVPVDQPFTITWEPTTEGTVSLVLFKGPAENLQLVYPIVEKIDNSGSYVWDPKETLEPSEGAKGYGIQLIDDKTGQYQYTTQFGISNKDYKQGGAPESYSAAPSAYASSASSAAVSSAASSVASSAVASSSVVAPVMSATSDIIHTTAAVSSAAPMTTSAAPYTIPKNTTAPGTSTIMSFSTGVAKPTGGNTTTVEPSTGGAANMAASFGGLVLAAGVAVFAL